MNRVNGKMNNEEIATEVSEDILLEKIENEPRNMENYYNLGHYYFTQHNFFHAIDVLNQAIEINEDYQDGWLLLGDIYLNVSEYQQAIKCVNRLIVLNPMEIKFKLLLANIYKEMGNFKETKQILENCLTQNPEKLEILNFLAILMRIDGKYDEAIKIYKQILEKNPKNVAVLNNLGIIYILQKKKYSAIATFKKAIKNCRDKNILYQNLIQFYLEEGYYIEATKILKEKEAYSKEKLLTLEEIFNKILENKDFLSNFLNKGWGYSWQPPIRNLNFSVKIQKLLLTLGIRLNSIPKSKFNLLMKGKYNYNGEVYNLRYDWTKIAILLHKMNPQISEKAFELALIYDSSDAFHIGESYFATGQYDLASAMFLKYKEKHPSHTRTIHSLILTYCRLGEYNEAIKLIQGRTDTRYNSNLAEAYFNGGKIELGIHMLNTIFPETIDIRRTPWGFVGYKYLIDVKDYEKAIAAYRIVWRATSDAVIGVNLSAAYSRKGDHIHALKICREILQKYPDNRTALLNISDSLYHLEKFDESLKYIEIGIQKYPFQPHFFYNKACLYSIQNKLEKSLKYLEIAIELSEKRKEMAKKDKDFKNLRNNQTFLDLIN